MDFGDSSRDEMFIFMYFSFSLRGTSKYDERDTRVLKNYIMGSMVPQMISAVESFCLPQTGFEFLYKSMGMQNPTK